MKCRILFILLFAITYTQMACQQKEKKQSVQPFTLENMQNLDSLLVCYTRRPVYYADYGNMACLFELRVNDILVDELTSPGSIGGTSSTINYCILRSGKQKVSLKLYPNPGSNYIWTNFYPTFQPFELSIVYVDFKLPEEEQEVVTVFKMPEIHINPDEDKIPYIKYEGEFEADIPYTLTGWEDCIDLREIDNIEERVVAEFNRVRQMMIDRQFTELRKYLYRRDYELSVALYESQKANDEGWNDYVSDIDEGLSYFQPIEDYEMVFSADGHSVTLKSKKKKGFPSALLWIKYKTETRYSFCYFELHLGIRKGTDEFVAFMS